MKRILLVVFLWISCVYAPPCFQPADGMNLWRMTAEIGSCLDIVLCSVGSVVMIMQTDLAAPYVITASDYYKVCENITSANPITISSNDVVLDLGANFLNGVSIIVSDGVKNVVIKNGTIKNVARSITIGASTQNIAVENIILDAAVSAATMYGIKATGPLLGLTLRDITLYDAAPQNIVLQGSLGNFINNVLFENINCASSNQGLFAIPGTDATIHLTSCTNVYIQNLIVNDPQKDIDCIFINACDNILLSDVNITSSVTSSGTGVIVLNSNNITHEKVNVTDVTTGFSVTATPFPTKTANFLYDGCSASSTASNGFLIAQLSNASFTGCSAIQCAGDGIQILNSDTVFCTDCDTSNNGGVGLNIGSTTNLAIKSHTSIANVGDGMYLSSCVAVTVGDSLISNNQGNGLNIDDQSQVTASDFLIEGTVFSENLFRGIDIKATTLANIIDVVIKDSTLQSNGLGGINCSFVDNVIISGCDAQSNGGDAFHIFGVNNGNNPFDTPANPQGNVGRSPFLIEGCAAIENTGHGFYSSNVGGVLVRDSFASYNGGLGFWYDNGSWNAQVENCTALSNGNVGFMTWDATAVATSFYKNRYRDCYGGQNSTASVFDPFGGGDFAQGNIQFNNMVTPLAAIYPSSVLGTPEIALFGTVSPIFCIFE